MIETEITILVNRKSDLDSIKSEVVDLKLDVPVYICEYQSFFEMSFVSKYEQWELDSALLKLFPEYEFVKDLGNGEREIRLQISRYQSELCSDGWGRPIEDPVREIKYLVLRQPSNIELLKPRVKVLFGTSEQEYYINITEGRNRKTGQEGYILINEFKLPDYTNDSQVYKNRLYQKHKQAVFDGKQELEKIVNDDYRLFKEKKKKERQKIERAPRKVVRDFIKACNESDFRGILSNIDSNISFEKIVRLAKVKELNGIDEFETYIKSSEQELCSLKLKIKSKWHINLPNLQIRVEYYPKGECVKFADLEFIVQENTIMRIKERR